jgi:hypothetical protein
LYLQRFSGSRFILQYFGIHILALWLQLHAGPFGEALVAMRDFRKGRFDLHSLVLWLQLHAGPLGEALVSMRSILEGVLDF